MANIGTASVVIKPVISDQFESILGEMCKAIEDGVAESVRAGFIRGLEAVKRETA